MGSCYEEYCYEHLCISFLSFISLEYIARSKSGSYSNYVELQTVSQTTSTTFHSYQQCTRELQFLHIPPATVIICLFDYSHPTGYKVVSHCSSNGHFSNGEATKHFFICLLATCISSKKCIFSPVPTFYFFFFF